MILNGCGVILQHESTFKVHASTECTCLIHPYSLKPFCFTFRNPIWHSETVMAVEGAAKIIKVLLFVFNFIFFVRTNQLRPWSNEFLFIPRFQRSVASSGNVTMLGDQQNLRIRKKYSRSRPHLNHPFNQQATIGFLQMFVMVFFIN